MTEQTFQFIGWIGLHFGRAGQIGAFFILIGLITGILWLVQKLPAPKSQPLCDYCRYENPNKDSTVFCCQHYKLCRPFQFRAKKCPHAETLSFSNMK